MHQLRNRLFTYKASTISKYHNVLCIHNQHTSYICKQPKTAGHLHTYYKEYLRLYHGMISCNNNTKPLCVQSLTSGLVQYFVDLLQQIHLSHDSIERIPGKYVIVRWNKEIETYYQYLHYNETVNDDSNISIKNLKPCWFF